MSLRQTKLGQTKLNLKGKGLVDSIQHTTMANEIRHYGDDESSYSDENISDVSLDEDDEELIGRVFYGDSENDYHSEDSDHDEDHSDESGDDIDGLSDIDDVELVNKYKALKEGKIDKDMGEEERKRLLITNFTEDQMERFVAYRRMRINKPGVKKICNGVIGHSIPNNIAVVLAGISKSFLGDIITKALEIQEKDYKSKLILDIDDKKKQKREIIKSLESGKDIEVDDRRLQYEGDYAKPLQPHHVREAWRIYKLENSGTFNPQWRRQGDSDGKFFT